MPSMAYIERRHGRDYAVVERRGSSRGTSTSELLQAAEEREIALKTQLGGAQWDLRNLTVEYQNVVNELQQTRYLRAQLDTQARENQMLEEDLDHEKAREDKLLDKVERLKEKIGLMRRSSYESYKEKFEEKCQEVEDLKRRILERDDMIRQRDEIIRLAETRILDKNQTIISLKNFLRDEGFRVL